MNSNLNFLFALLAVIVIVSLALMTQSCGSSRIPPPFTAHQSLEGAVRESAQNGRPVVAFFTADWCSQCQKFKRGALSSSRVRQWLEAGSTPVYIDATRASAGDLEAQVLLTRYRVGELPTLIVLEPGRAQDERERITGNVRRRDLQAWLKKALPEGAGG